MRPCKVAYAKYVSTNRRETETVGYRNVEDIVSTNSNVGFQCAEPSYQSSV